MAGPAYAPVRSRSQRFLHVARRSENLGQVLHVDELRGVPPGALLAGGAAIFRDGGAAARDDPRGTFAASRPAESLDLFISHSWRSRRAFKYAALVLRFNGAVAAALFAVAAYLAFCYELFFFDTLPEWLYFDGSSGVDASTPRTSCLSGLAGSVGLLAGLLAGHTARSDAAFLDIACIPQDDAERKTAGVEQLGAVLDRTSTMLCLVDESYWTRLWCVFEVAAFYHRAGPQRMAIVPLHLSFLCLANVALSVVNTFPLQYLLGTFGLDGMSRCLLILPIVVPLYCGVLAWSALLGARSQQALADLRSFQLHEAKCYDDDDREALLALIGDWFSEAHDGDEATRRQVGWHRFEQVVRNDLPRLLPSGGGALAVSRALLPGMLQACVTPTFYGLLANPRYNVWQSFLLFSAQFCSMLQCIGQGGCLYYGVRFAEWLCKHDCLRAAVIGVSLIACGLAQFACVEFFSVPVAFIDPEYRVPGDGLDEQTRIAVKLGFVCILNSASVLGCFLLSTRGP